jgi:hypothetical protein
MTAATLHQCSAYVSTEHALTLPLHTLLLHTLLLPPQTFMETLQQARDSRSLSPPLLAVLGRVCCLFGLSLVEGGAGDLLEAGWMTGGLGVRI